MTWKYKRAPIMKRFRAYIPAVIRVRPGLFGVCIAALLMAVPQDLRAEPPDADWLNTMIGQCDECHAPERAMHEKHMPHLAGQNKSFFIKQMHDFQKITAFELKSYQLSLRQNHVMDYLSSPLTEAEVAALASYYSRLPCQVEYDPEEPIPVSQIPASIKGCIQCHGVNGIAVKDKVPNLAGQNRTYIMEHLKLMKKSILEYNKGWMPGAPEPIPGLTFHYNRTMGQWAVRVSEDELALIARYYSRLPCGGTPR